MPPWQRRQSGGFFRATAKRIRLSPSFVSINDCPCASFMMKEKDRLNIFPEPVCVRAGRRRNRLTHQISSRNHIRSLLSHRSHYPTVYQKLSRHPILLPASADPITQFSFPITHVLHVQTIHALITPPSTFTILPLSCCGWMLRMSGVGMTRNFQCTCWRQF
jgi:hypothetical protein